MKMEAEELHRDFNGLVGRYLSGELSPEELDWFQNELQKDPGKKSLLDDYRKIWDSATPEETYDLDAEWSRLQEKLPAKNVRTTHSLLYYSYRIAAVLVVGLVLTFTWIYLNRLKSTVQVLAEDIPVEVILEDGTEILVNRNSTLRYSRKEDPDQRKVWLSGEAWFDVASDTTRPFLIDAGMTLVEVLGTSFNVNAYKTNPTVEITVESGLVAMSSKEDEKDLIVMKAGSGGSYDKSRRSLKLIPTTDPNSISWKTRELFFDASTLREVADLLNKVYGVNIRIEDEGLAACPITVTFRDQTLEAILKVLEMTLDLQITRSGDEISLHGEACVE